MSRESLAMKVGFSFTGQRVVAVLEELASRRGLPQVIYVDNGPEFTSRVVDEGAHRHSVKLACSRPGKPTDHPFIEAFHGHFRQECLNLPWFGSLEEASAVITAWRVEYHTGRPHSALHNRTPAAYSADWLQTRAVKAAGD